MSKKKNVFLSQTLKILTLIYKDLIKVSSFLKIYLAVKTLKKKEKTIFVSKLQAYFQYFFNFDIAVPIIGNIKY